MIPLPTFLKRFQRKAEKFLASDLVKDVEFSGKTYQVLVDDTIEKNEYWVFLQLDEYFRLADSFCACEESEKGYGCVHQAVAFLYIYGKYNQPLHQRFEASLWNAICQESVKNLGDQSSSLKTIKPGHYEIVSKKKEELFDIHSLNLETTHFLNKLFFERKEETEETSLKFSNLSEHEISLWQQGKPTFPLRYELSFWSDLAKWLMTLQDSEAPYTILFTYGANTLPETLSVKFSCVSITWHLTQETLEEIIPSLSTVKSPLQIHNRLKEEIEKIVYDKEKKCLVVVPKKNIIPPTPETSQAVDIGHWTYKPQDGFYCKDRHFLLDAHELHDVEDVLNNYSSVIKELIDEAIIHEALTTVSYAISFDNKWNLHLKAFLFKAGDLNPEDSNCFGTWTYLRDVGFYKLEPHEFPSIETTISENEIEDFVTQHRTWFNLQEGFRTYLTPIEANLSYHLREDKFLEFTRNLSVEDHTKNNKDFGKWVYVTGQGFFSKIQSQSGLPISPGKFIPPDQIPMFIHTNREELRLIKNFFSSYCPVQKSSLHIEITNKNQVIITPEYELTPEYQAKTVYYFDDITYVEGEGFYELSGVVRLPERFQHLVVIKEDDLPQFMTQELPKLIPFVSYLDPRLKRPSQAVLVADEVEKEQMNDKFGYALKLGYQTDLGIISAAALWTALQQNKRFVFSDAGVFDLSETRFDWLKIFSKQKMDKRTNTLKLNALELLRLNASEEVTIASGAQHTPSAQLLQELTEFRPPEEAPDLTGLTSQLRPYQTMGLQWLWFLYHHHLSGLLCDDMGLGKTHQAMALLRAIANQEQKQGHSARFLVVCPTSVIYHWQEKLNVFLPNLKVWTFYGANRTLENQEYDILLTSYGILRNETKAIASIKFNVAIFDELQIAKNQTSRIYSALLKTNSDMRLGLTGTPIENNLRELKALFDIILPHYMPSEKDYRDFFIRPIQKEANQERKLVLSKLIKPFTLRRKKEDVLFDLPEKTEEISHCDLSTDQFKLYVEILSSARSKILEELRNDKTPIPYMHIFALLSRLKQLCNHPAAYLKKPEEYKNYQSGKWDLFLELLEEARESKQKVVVFSQYLSMLDIMESYLKENEIGYATIRGATINRAEPLQRFNNDPNCEVFIASLQAAGLGVDLTAGSVVIHYDRWWNAARENQATDRVHRIGQTRGVQVFKLMTKDTLEERIDFLISKKSKLLEDVLGVDDHQIIKKFDREELIGLIQTLPTPPSDRDHHSK